MGSNLKSMKNWNSIPQETNKIDDYEEFVKNSQNQSITTFYGPQFF